MPPRTFAKTISAHDMTVSDAIDGKIVTADTPRVAPHLTHLLEQVGGSRLVLPPR